MRIWVSCCFALLVFGSSWAQAPVDSTRADLFVSFSSFPDLSGAADIPLKEDKAAYVYAVLSVHGQQYEDLFQELRDSSVAFEYLWAAGALYVANADSTLRNRLQSDVRVACVSDELNLVMPTPKWDEEHQGVDLASRSVEVTTWGLEYIGAPQVWEEGVRGAGAVVGGQDTGYDWDHPALKEKYRGYVSADSVSHSYNWYDAVEKDSPLTTDTTTNPCGYRSDEACDDGNHGTHTMGTMVGSEDTLTIGVAPEATWVGCRSMERGWGRPETYVRCFQWFLAPTDTDGETPRPDLAPDVIANSWYCPLDEGCDDCTYAAFDNVIYALRASGVVVVASAGNDGRAGCNTVNRIPALSPGALSVAAHDINGTIASFSSRGDASVPGNGPDLAAPGVDVLSSVPDSSYSSFGGTSMAGPHVAGVVALMISANPALRGQVDTLEAMLLGSTVPVALDSLDACSASGGYNQLFGQGTLNAVAAVAAARAYQGTSSVGPAVAKTFPVHVAPNPVGEGFTLTVPQAALGGQLRVLDAVGQVVHAQRLRQVGTYVASAAWTPGVYVYQVVSEAGVSSGQVVR